MDIEKSLRSEAGIYVFTATPQDLLPEGVFGAGPLTLHQARRTADGNSGVKTY